MALPNGAVGWSAVCDRSIPDHTHLLFNKVIQLSGKRRFSSANYNPDHEKPTNSQINASNCKYRDK